MLVFDVNLLMLSFFCTFKKVNGFYRFLLNIRMLILVGRIARGENKFLFLSLLQDVEVI